jgi:hypothetical protein
VKRGEERRDRHGGGWAEGKACCCLECEDEFEVYRMGGSPAGSKRSWRRRAAQREILATRVDSWQETGVEGGRIRNLFFSFEREQSA